MGNHQMSCCGSKPKARKTPLKPKVPPPSVEYLPTLCPPSPTASQSDRWSNGEIRARVEACVTEFRSAIRSTEEKPLPLQIQRPGIHIYGTDTKRGFLLKSVWESPYPAETVLAFTQNTALRLTWDVNLAERYAVGNVTEDISISYERYRKILGVAQRDLLSAGKTCKLEDGSILDASVSVEVADIPVNEGIIRAHLYMGGYHIRPTAHGCSISLYNDINYGGALPNKLLVPMSARTMLGFIEAFNTSLAKASSN